MRIYRAALIFGLLLATPFVMARFTSALTIDLQPKYVDGVILTSSLHKPNGAPVTATCNGHTATGATNSNGRFHVTFGNGDCPIDKPVSVFISYNGESVGANSTSGVPDVIEFGVLQLSPTASVPEFGSLTGIAAAGASLAYFFYKKRVA